MLPAVIVAETLTPVPPEVIGISGGGTAIPVPGAGGTLVCGAVEDCVEVWLEDCAGVPLVLCEEPEEPLLPELVPVDPAAVQSMARRVRGPSRPYPVVKGVPDETMPLADCHAWRARWVMGPK